MQSTPFPGLTVSLVIHGRWDEHGFPIGAEERTVSSSEPSTSQGLSSLPGRRSDGVSQACTHDDLAIKTHQLALGSTTTPTFQLFALHTLSPWGVEVLRFPRGDPMLLTSRGKAPDLQRECPCHLLTLGPKALLIRFWGPRSNSFTWVAFWQDLYSCRKQCPPTILTAQKANGP